MKKVRVTERERKCARFNYLALVLGNGFPSVTGLCLR